MANYANDNTPYSFSPELDNVFQRLKNSTYKLFEWFLKNKKKYDKSIIFLCNLQKLLDVLWGKKLP